MKKTAQKDGSIFLNININREVVTLERLMLFIATEKGYSVLKKIYECKKDCLVSVISFNEVNVKKITLSL